MTLRSKFCGNTEEESQPSNSTELSDLEISKLVLKDILDTEISFEKSKAHDLILNSSQYQKIETLPAYEDTEKQFSGSYILNKYPKHYRMCVRVIVDGDEISIKPEYIFYTADEIHNEAVGEFIRSFGYRGPEVKVDLEKESPKLVLHQY